MTETWAHSLLDNVGALARQAGAVAMSIYMSDFAVQRKADGSLVTTADQEAEAVILAGLKLLSPNIPIIAEEEAAAGRYQDIGRLFWLVDPLDGTEEFVQRNGEFTVNIALIEAGIPVLGVVYAPAVKQFYAAAGPGSGIVEINGETRTICSRPLPDDGVVVVTSRRHGNSGLLNAFLKDYTVKSTITAGSSLKLCLVADGQADLYPRFGRTMEWDIAAGHAILLAAGGKVQTTTGEDLRYGKSGFDNPHFIAYGANLAGAHGTPDNVHSAS